MSTVITHPAVDAVVLGEGVMGGEITIKLTLAGYKVVGIEKGPYWDYTTDFAITKYDEYGIQIMRKNDHPLAMSTVTLRNNSTQFALPVRRNSNGQATSSGHGVGGAAHHYGAQFGRYEPWTYAIHSNTVSKYGQAFLDAANPNDDTIDFPNTYDDYLPYYQDFEMGWGVSGTNQEPNCPSSTYPMPPHPQTAVSATFQAAAESLGITNWAAPSAIASQPYTNQYGVQVNACVYDGWCNCTSYPCETGAKANSATRTIPAAIKTGNLDLRTNSYLFRIDTDPVTGLATQARYYDAMGNIHIQPAKVFAVTTWGFLMFRALALSGLGQQYNSTTVTGSLGRGPHDPTGAPTRTATGTLAIGQNNYTAGNGQGGSWTTYDFADDNFDHTNVPVPYIGGTRIAYGGYPSSPGLIAIGAAGSAANIGSAYKASVKNKTQVTKQTISAASAGMNLPSTQHYFDLDPHYADIYGDPLPRYTIDYSINAPNASNDSVRLWTPVVTKMGVTNLTAGPAVTPGSTHYTAWGIHIRGGVRIGSDSTTSVMNKWNQLWGTNNVFAAGEVTQPNGSSVQTGGTHPASVTAHAAAAGIQQYLKTPGPLV
jgi:gluconate 2-dehydrogenase alpha chain